MQAENGLARVTPLAFTRRGIEQIEAEFPAPAETVGLTGC